MQQLIHIRRQLRDRGLLGPGRQLRSARVELGGRQFLHATPGVGIEAMGARAITTGHHPPARQGLDQPGGLLQLQPPGNQQKTTHPIEGHPELLGQGAGHHHRQPGARKSPWAKGHRQTANLRPLLGRQHRFHRIEELVGEGTAQGERLASARRVASKSTLAIKGGHPNAKHLAGAVQSQHQAHGRALMTAAPPLASGAASGQARQENWRKRAHPIPRPLHLPVDLAPAREFLARWG